MKYQKNVLNLLQNILLRHNVIIEPIFESGIKKIGKDTKPCAKLCISSIKSDSFEYKIKDGTLITDAKDKRYLETIKKLLYYPDIESNVKILLRKDNFNQNKDKKNVNNRKTKNNNKNGNRNRDKNSGGDGLTYNPFLNLIFDLPE